MQENQMKVIKSSESSEFYSILRLWEQTDVVKILMFCM